MAQCYHEKAVFSDPVFGELRGVRIGAMWQMLCERASSDFRIESSDIVSDDSLTAQYQKKDPSARPVETRHRISHR
jgi:hypothetical protein